MDERTKRTVFLIVGGILYTSPWWILLFSALMAPSSGGASPTPGGASTTPTWVWIIILGGFLAFIGTILWFWGCYLWVKLKNRHWAFTFLGFLSLIGILIIWSLDDRSDKVTKEEPTEVAKGAKETPSQALLETVGKQLKPRYCEKCGSQLVVRRLQEKGFDQDTGYPKCDAIIACPNAVLYETSPLVGAKVVWKSKRGGHTVDKVSVIVHPEDRKKHV